MPRDPRTFITVHNGMPYHPKVAPLSDAAFRLVLTAWCWCSQQGTDGAITARMWQLMGKERVRQELLDAGLVEQDESGDYLVHDYLEHQLSAAEIEERRAVRQANGRKGGVASGRARRSKAQATASSKPEATASTEPEAVGSVLVEANANGIEADVDVDVDVDRTQRSRERTSRSLGDARKRAHKIPEGWEPTLADRAWAKEQGFPAPYIGEQLDEFRDHWRSKGEARLDWSASWRNWMRRAAKWHPPADPARPHGWEWG